MNSEPKRGWLAGYWASTQEVIGDEEVKIKSNLLVQKIKKNGFDLKIDAYITLWLSVGPHKWLIFL